MAIIGVAITLIPALRHTLGTALLIAVVIAAAAASSHAALMLRKGLKPARR